MILVSVGLHVMDCGRLLVQQRPSEKMNLKGRWEFPGGKVEPGETMREALKREWWEELNLKIEVGRLVDERVVSFPECGPVLLPLFEVFYDKSQIYVPHERQEVRCYYLDEVLKLPCVPSMEQYADAVRAHVDSLRAPGI